MSSREPKSQVGTILIGLLKRIDVDLSSCSSCGFLQSLDNLSPKKIKSKQHEIEQSILKRRSKKHEAVLTPDVVHDLINYAAVHGDPEAAKPRGFGTLVRKSLECLGITKDLMRKLGINCGCAEREKRWNEAIPFPRRKRKKKKCGGCKKKTSP